MNAITRRHFITAALAASACAPVFAADKPKRLKIGACDWSLGKAADPGSLQLAKEIGLDGVQVSLGSASDGLRLRQAEVQQRFKDAARSLGVEVLSLGLAELNNVPFKSDPRTVPWVADSIDVCRALGCRVLLLAFFHRNDLRNDPAGMDETVRRLKELAPRAEKAGVILGLESWLSAEQHVSLMDRVGSPALKVYYDVANSEQMGYDIDREIRWLGKQGLICEFHMKENGALLGRGRVDFKKVRAALDDIVYRGAMQIEGAIPPGGKMKESYVLNRKFLQELFA